MQQNTVKNNGMFTQMFPQQENVGKQNGGQDLWGHNPEPRMGQDCEPNNKESVQPSLDEIWEWLGDPDAE